METALHLWTSYEICYAIGYMLLLRPVIQKKVSNKIMKISIDYIFYISLIVFSTIKFINS